MMIPEHTKTLRPSNEGGEKWIEKEITCLDHGFVRLIDYMGNDSEIARAARVSYGRGTRKISEDEGLIRYLLRNKHTSPFEMVEIKFHCKLPIFVARQWIRHRTANVNEYSGRYSQMSSEFYVPGNETLKKQSQTNRQGGGDDLEQKDKEKILSVLIEDAKSAYEHYDDFLKMDLAREQARIGLPLSLYTEWYWKIDLHNLLHFLKLRLDPHAQYEIRVYANAIAEILKDLVPLSYRAFEDYVLDAMIFSKQEVEWMREVLLHIPKNLPLSEQYVVDHTPFEKEKEKNTKRETDDFIKKLKKMGMVG